MKATDKWLYSVIVILLIGLTLSFVQNLASAEEKLCKEAKEKRGVNSCENILFVDFKIGLVFFEHDKRIYSTNIDRKAHEYDIYNGGGLKIDDIEEPIFWEASDTLLWGIATNEVYIIRLVNENNLEPNKVRMNSGWLWYFEKKGSNINFPILINAYNQQGNLIYGKVDDEADKIGLAY